MFPVPDAKEIHLIVYDFDGVMTNNKVTVDQNGVESVIVNRGDGYGVSRIKDLAISQVIISTEVNEVVKHRAKKLGIPAIHGVGDKRCILQDYCVQNNIPLSQVLFIGNDLNDYDAMMSVGYPCCPADAEIEIREISKLIFTSKGGEGVVRELYRYLSCPASH